MMRAPLRMWGSALRVTLNVPVMLTAIVRSHSSGDSVVIGTARVTVAALFTSTSTPCRAEARAAKKASTAGRSVMSQW